MPSNIAEPSCAVLTPTPSQILGPYYPIDPDRRADNDLTRWPGEPMRARGSTMRIDGRVLDTFGLPVAGALIETWQCDAQGYYRHPDAPDHDKVDPHFEGYGRFHTLADGRYCFRALKPVSYPGRAPHLHFLVSVPGHAVFITQMYVADEAENDTDFALWRAGGPDHRARLIVALRQTEGAAEDFQGTFDIVLRGTGGRR